MKNIILLLGLAGMALSTIKHTKMLAKQSPTLDVGGSVEVREVRPTPVSTSK